MYDIVQIAGSLLILAAFLLTLVHRLDQDSRRYLAVNALGSAVLTGVAVVGRDWGFLLLEGVWAVASTVSLVRTVRVNRTG